MADVRGGTTVGSLRVESRTIRFVSAVLQDCLFLDPIPEQGVHTTRTSALDPGSFTVTDVRLGYNVGSGLVNWLAWGGLGWTWSRDVPVALLGGGLHLGRAVRAVLEADVMAYRIPWNVLTAEWQNHQVVREFERGREHDWRSGFSFRIGVEFAPFSFR